MGNRGGRMSFRAVTPELQRRLTPDELRARLRQVGDERYHHRHPFHVLMHEGKLSRGALQAWALNRYYYQSRIPIKDAIVLSRSEDPAFRRAWRKRVLDHDVGPFGGRDRTISREGDCVPRGASGSSFRRRRLHQPGKNAVAARGGRIVAD
jgi:hypothetical protein